MSVRESLRLNDVCCGDVICVLERPGYRAFVLSDEWSEAKEDLHYKRSGLQNSTS